MIKIQPQFAHLFENSVPEIDGRVWDQLIFLLHARFSDTLMRFWFISTVKKPWPNQ